MSTLLILLVGMALFTLGLGVGIWDRVENINVIFYAGALFIFLSGISWFGFEALMGFRAYRQTTSKRFEQASNLSTSHVYLPTLPKPQLLDVDIETLEAAEMLFYQVENNGHQQMEGT
jgi:hypothetical protein